MEATMKKEGSVIQLAATAAYSGGQVLQLSDGRAGVVTSDVASGGMAELKTTGIFTSVPKTAGQVYLDGQELFWDHSANAVVYTPGADKDFYLGTAVGDAASAATTCTIHLNNRPSYLVDLVKGQWAHAPVLTAGTPILRTVGGSSVRAEFSATAEAQKLDLLSLDGFAVASNWILEAVVTVDVNADADVADLNIGVANGTHASDADQIAEAVFFHLDMGGSLNLSAESDDGTTDVNAVDTTVDWAVGTALHLMVDGRDPTDVQMYVNGANVLPGTTFTLAQATGPLRALFHLEKSANDSPGAVSLHALRVRTAEQ